MKLDPRIFLYLDFETRSPHDIKACGLENYARSAEALMLGWALNDGPVNLWVPEHIVHEPGPIPPMDTMPADLAMYLFRPEIIKVAWNAAFERAILKHALGIDVPVNQWMDPSAMSRYASGPSHLGTASEAFGLGSAEAKDMAGRQLWRKFCLTGKKYSKTAAEAPEDWQRFCEYCKQDVIAERALFKKLLPAFELPEREKKILALDQKINERGIPVDMKFVKMATWIVDSERERLLREMRELTGLENPNSTQQLLAWLRERGYPYSSLGKKWVDAAVNR